jgi:hypothetical protein
MKEMTSNDLASKSLRILSFSNDTSEGRGLLKKFVDFHWEHYQNDAQYIPLLDYEYLGARILGITGYFEKRNLFHKHGKSHFFLAERNGKVVGRCNAFINFHHNEHWKDKVGFFGNFECIQEPEVSRQLLAAAEAWVREQGMDTIRGPQNFPVNEATPGFLVDGFASRPVIYYHYNKSYYKDLALACGYQPSMSVLSWEVPIATTTMDTDLESLCQKLIKRYNVTFEHWAARPLAERKKEMREIYNDAWNDNFGFVPFIEEEFDKIVDDMQLIMDKKLFLFVYVKGEAAAFFGGVPNIMETLVPSPLFKRFELLRAVKMLLGKSKVDGYRLGYLGIKQKFRKLGLDGIMLWRQCAVSKQLGYGYCDMGYILETNALTVRLAERFGGIFSKRYTLFEKKLLG